MLAGPAANFILAVGILSIIFVNSVERQFIPEVSNISSQYLKSNTSLKAGDILTSINEKKVSSLQDIRLELLSLSGTNGSINFNPNISLGLDNESNYTTSSSYLSHDLSGQKLHFS